MKVLQNQNRFTTKPYSDVVTPLKDAASAPCLWVLNRFGISGFAAGIVMFITRKRYDVVVTVGHKTTFSYGLLNFIIMRRTRQAHIAKEIFIHNPSKQTNFGLHILRIGFRKCDLIIVNSNNERQYLSDLLHIDINKTRFIPWPSNIEPSCASDDKGYVFAAGRSLRDWDTLIQVAQHVDFRFIIVTSRESISRLPIPENISIYYDITHAEYLSLLSKATIVIVPLVQSPRSTGQAVSLEAMSMGKAIIATDTSGTKDYIQNMYNGLLCKAYDPEDLLSKVHMLLGDIDLRNKLGENAIRSVSNNFNKRSYAQHMYNCALDAANKCSYKLGTP